MKTKTNADNNGDQYARRLIEASLDPFVTISIDGKITDVNKATITALPNRRLYRERASQMLELAKRNKTKFALLFLDVNNFKHYNDTFGHEFGDAVLIKTAQKLNKIFRKSDIISRWAGDEFVVLIDKICPAIIGIEIGIS